MLKRKMNNFVMDTTTTGCRHNVCGKFEVSLLPINGISPECGECIQVNDTCLSGTQQ